MKEKATKLMSVKRSAFMLLLFVFASFQAFAQGKDISGVVKDDKGEAIIGATIKVKGNASLGTITDFNGEYKLSGVPEDAKAIEVTYVGYETKTLPIKGSKVDVVLKEDSKELEAVVVTGYGETKKRDVVTSVASVGEKELKNIPVTTAAEAMQGKLTGVSVTTTEGSPDASVKIRVRGGGSLTQSNDPLYIVDGFQVSNISDISPSEIQSMDVLKDAAATAIYGAQGANGVIIITTKDAKVDDKDDCSSKINVDYTGYIGWKKITKTMDLLSNRDFALLQYENQYLKDRSQVASKYNAYFDKKYVDSNVLTPISSILDSIGQLKGRDWQNETFGRTGFNSNHSVTVSGGNKKADFTASFNHIDDKAIMKESSYQRDNISLKSKFKPAKGLTLAFTSRFSQTDVLGAGSNTSDDKGSSTQSRMRNAVQFTPIDLLKVDLSDQSSEDKVGGLYNPLVTIADNYKDKIDTRYSVNGSAAYKFLKDWTVRSELGFDSKNIETDRYYGPTTYYALNTGKTGVSKGTSSLVYTVETDTKMTNSNTINFEHRYKGGHNVSALLGEETVVNKGEVYTFNGYGYESTFSGKEVFNYLSQATVSEFGNYIDPTDNMLSFFARANYDYKSRYYFTATMRADGTTRFSTANQWGYFPAFAFAWRLSDEKFMRDFNSKVSLSNLKIRFSYGTAGNNNVDLGYLHTDFLGGTTSNVEYFSKTLIAGGSEKIAPNPNLKWETTTTRDLGFDYGFFNDRLSGAFDVYLNTTSDLIVKYKISSGGYNYQYRNIGSTENRGLEFSVKGVILDKRSKDLNYGLSLDANISANRGKVTSLGGMTSMTTSTSSFNSDNLTTDEFLVTVGDPIGQIYGFVSDGWYKASDFASYTYSATKDTWTLNTGVVTPYAGMTASPGRIKLKDLSGDGAITDADKAVIGNTLPLFTGGFAVNAHIGGAKFGDLDFSANFTYSYGNDVLNLNRMDYTTILTGNDNTSYRNSISDVAYGKRYSLFAADGTYLPSQLATVYGNGTTVTGAGYTQMAAELDAANSSASIWSPYMEKYVVTNYCVEDGSFLRLASLTLGYSLPDRLLKKAYISKARFFFTASNLFVLTNYSGFDPEVDTRSEKNPLTPGVDFSSYPKSRAFNVGVNLSF